MDELRDRAGDLALLPACNFADSSMCERRYGSYGEILTHGGWIYVYVYVYVIVFVYVFVHAYVYVCMHVCTYVLRPNSPTHTMYYVLTLYTTS